MALACTDDTSDRFYSMSSQIETERKAYYRELETAQRGDMDITRWLTWFLGCLDRHGASRHSRTAGQGHPGAKPWRRPQHELPTRFAGQRGCVIAARRTPHDILRSGNPRRAAGLWYGMPATAASSVG